MSQYLETALAWYDIGACPIRAGHNKRPIGAWSNYQHQRPTRDVVKEWFTDPQTLGIGLVCGKVSGNLEMLEIEGRAANADHVKEIAQRATNLKLGHLVQQLISGYVEHTPSGGVHFIYRISDHEVPGNTKIASNVEGLVTHETRGEGGFVVIAPTAGDIHDTKKPWITQSQPHQIATFTWEERNQLHALFASFNEYKLPEYPQEGTPLNDPNAGRPGDDFNAQAKWADILQPHGWTIVFTDNKGVTHWRRPDKNDGTSATVGHNGSNNLYVFSTSTIFNAGQSYSPFAAYAILNHGGNYQEASRALRQLGYGTTYTELASFTPNLEIATTPLPITADPIAVLNRRINEELINQRARREAKKHLDSEDAAKTYKPPTYTYLLGDELKAPDPDLEWAITDLLPLGGNALLTAPYKSGKTTLINHLVQSLADKTKFMGHFEINPNAGRVVVFNYEVDGRQYRRWLREVAIQEVNRVTLVHLRGMRLPIIARPVEDLVVQILKDTHADTWIIDPFARAFTGCGDENSNSDVGVFLDTLDIIKERAGVNNLIVAAHTGRAVEHGIDRARGATRLDDWADVRWLLHKADDGTRFFSAEGRDVSQEEQMLTYIEATRALKFGGWDRSGHKRLSAEQQVLDYIQANHGCKSGDIAEGLDISPNTVTKAVKGLVRMNKVKVVEDGTSKKHWPTGVAIAPFQGATA